MLSQQVGDPADTAFCLNNLGIISQEQGKLEQALQFHKRALKLREQVGNPVDIAISLNNIGKIYEQQGKWNQAIKHYSEALSLYKRLGRGFESHVADELELLASGYSQLGEIEKGIPYYRDAEQIRREIKESR